MSQRSSSQDSQELVRISSKIPVPPSEETLPFLPACPAAVSSGACFGTKGVRKSRHAVSDLTNEMYKHSVSGSRVWLCYKVMTDRTVMYEIFTNGMCYRYHICACIEKGDKERASVKLKYITDREFWEKHSEDYIFMVGWTTKSHRAIQRSLQETAKYWRPHVWMEQGTDKYLQWVLKDYLTMRTNCGWQAAMCQIRKSYPSMRWPHELDTGSAGSKDNGELVLTSTEKSDTEAVAEHLRAVSYRLVHPEVTHPYYAESRRGPPFDLDYMGRKQKESEDTSQAAMMMTTMNMMNAANH